MHSARIRRGAATVAAVSACASGLAACGGDEVATRPAHRPISVVYVAGEPDGPWRTRLEGLADGVKLAIAERGGLIGQRAASVVVTPILQRDGDTVSAAIGGGRILRDSRAIAVLGAFTAPQLALAVPQFNGGEISSIQYGTGMGGLLTKDLPQGEPERYEPSGHRYELRGVPADQALADRAAKLPGFRGGQLIAVQDAYDAELRAEAVQRAKAARTLRADALAADDGQPVPSTDPALTNPSPEVPDARRIGVRVMNALKATPVSAKAPAKPGRPTIVVTDPTEPDPTAAARKVLRGITGPVLLIDGADRNFDAGALGRPRGSTTYELRRTVADASTTGARAIRAKERAQFGRDRGDAVVAGYLAARRILALAAKAPEKTIDRVDFATELTREAGQDPDLPVDAAGQVTLGAVKALRLSGGRWVPVTG